MKSNQQCKQKGETSFPKKEKQNIMYIKSRFIEKKKNLGL